MSKTLAVCIMGLFIAIGVIAIISMIISKIRCTEEVEAVVDELIASKDSDLGNAYYPVFLYWYEGAEYRRKSGFSSLFLKFREGDRVRLFIDPNKPERFYCPKETIHKVLFFLLFSGSSAAIMALFLIT